MQHYTMIGRLILSKAHRRVAGDTYPLKATIRVKEGNDLVPVDITGSTGTFNFKNTSAGKQTIDGTVTDGPNGKIEFAPAEGQMDADGSYSYNIKMLIAGKVTTFAKGELILEDDL